MVESNLRKMTVADYIKYRFEELGLTKFFGVPGNYCGALLDTILADKNSPIKCVSMSNELVAGYAADGYARSQGKKAFGAVYCTFGVGSFVLLNAVGGSYTENVPVVILNGAPTRKELNFYDSVGL